MFQAKRDVVQIPQLTTQRLLKQMWLTGGLDSVAGVDDSSLGDSLDASAVGCDAAAVPGEDLHSEFEDFCDDTLEASASDA